MPDPFRSREDLPKAKKKKKKKEGAAYHLRMFTHTQKIFVRHFRLSVTVNWGGEKASPSSLSRLPPNQNLKQRRYFFSKQNFEHKVAEQNREKAKFAIVTHTTRAPSACASKLLYPQNGGVGAWAIHGIWWNERKCAKLQGLGFYPLKS